jgi:hypothetical protein
MRTIAAAVRQRVRQRTENVQASLSRTSKQAAYARGRVLHLIAREPAAGTSDLSINL